MAIRRSDVASDTWLRALLPWLFANGLYDTPEAVTAAAQAALNYPYAQSADAMSHQIDALAAFGAVYPDLTPTVPVQCLLARDDLLIPIKDAQTALAQYPQHVIEQAGHSIHWDAPDQVADHMLRFIHSNPIKGAA